MAGIRYLTAKEVISINIYLINRYSKDETAGVKDASLLDSAINRPKQSAFCEDAYPSIFEKAAALFQSLALNHAFHSANKRTAFTSMVQFLKYNGLRFLMDPKEAEDFVVDTVLHKYDFDAIVHMIREHTTD
ncbi:type II toxin-antitoxin system death-on-curing family toxin [Lentibacillus salinarum]|uniref:Type II toxin-antitoxin system death-on-curing family toxin n=1 Tax=Lentibacillus salinarum TaxID=446820 RepID=A0ABW3ZRD5_9BACI